ncbi:MAG: YidC/Oxa1 family membrane protein insertase [Clostridia bacterium]|nr:YidC/Oxa1 family membrane protein insertase [Clostridia bacterium]
MYILADPLAFIIRPIYNLIQNYGLTLIIVTILIRLITIPLTVMSQKSVAKTQLIQPEMMKIQEKYKNDKNKQSIELQKLYQKHNVNPLGGCLPLIVQMFVLFGFIGVIYNPLEYILQLSKEQISAISQAVGATKSTYQVTLCGMQGVAEQIKELGLTPINFNFYGIDLTRILKGNEKDLMMWIFPVLAVVATYISGYITKKQTPQPAPSKNGEVEPPNMANSMMTIMPIMTAIFTYTMPAGMSLYWFVSTAFQILQQTLINKIINKKVKEEIEGKRK